MGTVFEHESIAVYFLSSLHREFGGTLNIFLFPLVAIFCMFVFMHVCEVMLLFLGFFLYGSIRVG